MVIKKKVAPKKTSVVKKEEDKNYYKTKVETVREHFSQFSSDGRWFKAKEGKNVVRILPPWGKSANGSFYYSESLHYGIKIGGNDRTIACHAQSIAHKGKCPVCMLIERIKETESSDYDALANKLKGRRKFWVNLLEVDKNGNDSDKVLIYGGNPKFIKAIMGALEDDDYGDVTDPEEGNDLIIERTGSGINTRYEYRVRPKPRAVTNLDWQEQLFKLSEPGVVVEWLGWDEMVGLVKANFQEALDELELEFPREKKKPEKKKVNKRETDEDEEDEEDEEEDDEDSASEENDEEDEEEDGEDDE